MRDNYDLWDAHDAEQARAEAKTPVCSICWEHMWEWYRISLKFGDLLVCENCISHEYYEED